jgi:hypothetical protein
LIDAESRHIVEHGPHSLLQGGVCCAPGGATRDSAIERQRQLVPGRTLVGEWLEHGVMAIVKKCAKSNRVGAFERRAPRRRQVQQHC